MALRLEDITPPAIAVATSSITAIQKILDHEEVELLQCEDVRLFRPVGQAGAPIVDEGQEIGGEMPTGPRGPVAGQLDP